MREWKLRPGRIAIADQLIDSTESVSSIAAARSRSTNRFASAITIDVEIDATRELPRSPAASRSTPIAAPRRWRACRSRPGGMYSHKGMFPATGELRVGDKTFAFAGDTLALLDDHKGYYPYVMRWDWVTSAVYQDGVARGFNLTRNQCRAALQRELRVDRRSLGVLPAVDSRASTRAPPESAGASATARAASTLTFTPTVPGDVGVNAVVVGASTAGRSATSKGGSSPRA